MRRNGRNHLTVRSQPYETYIAQATDCGVCALRSKCINIRGRDDKTPLARGCQVSRFLPTLPHPSHSNERMRQAIDLPRGRQLYSQCIGTVEPVVANLRHNKRFSRFNYRGQGKVRLQWSLNCLVHNIEKLSTVGLG